MAAGWVEGDVRTSRLEHGRMTIDGRSLPHVLNRQESKVKPVRRIAVDGHLDREL
jgi:hypothetical protein